MPLSEKLVRVEVSVLGPHLAVFRNDDGCYVCQSEAGPEGVAVQTHKSNEKLPISEAQANGDFL